MLEHAQLFFQPQINASDRAFVGIECLLREVFPNGKIGGPQRLLAQVEAAGEGDRLDWWVLNEGIMASKRWPTLVTAINVSAARFLNPEFPGKLAALLARHNVPPSRIDLEILEGGLIHNLDQGMQAIDDLHALGVKVSLDDFGTGYSSLNYLQKLPVDKIKLDRIIVEGVGQLKSTAVIQAVCALARALGMKVLAEGVERAEQAALLRTLGCHQYQGFYFSPAVPAARIDEFLASDWPSRP